MTQNNESLGSVLIAQDLGSRLVQPLLIRAALGQAPFAVPRYAAEVRMLDKVRVATFNKGTAARIDDGHELPTFAELLVASRLRAAGWKCTWVNAYHRRFIETWAWDAAKPTVKQPPEHLLETLKRIAAKVASVTKLSRNLFDGVPDIMAWSGHDILFIECKRRGKDRIQQTQAEWLHAAIMIGINVMQLGIFEWHYSGEADRTREGSSKLRAANP